jgi:DNA-binding MarR family transcriptional regulator
LDDDTQLALKQRDRETIARTKDHLALRVWLRLLTCTLKIERQVRARLRHRFSTTLPRFDLMAQLERHPEGLRMNELSQLLMVTSGNVTGIVEQLMKAGLIERGPDPVDRRAFRVRLTAAGEKRFGAMARAHETWIIEILSGLSRSEQEVIFDLLGKVKRHMPQQKSK